MAGGRIFFHYFFLAAEDSQTRAFTSTSHTLADSVWRLWTCSPRFALPFFSFIPYGTPHLVSSMARRGHKTNRKKSYAHTSYKKRSYARGHISVSKSLLDYHMSLPGQSSDSSARWSSQQEWPHSPLLQRSQWPQESQLSRKQCLLSKQFSRNASVRPVLQHPHPRKSQMHLPSAGGMKFTGGDRLTTVIGSFPPLFRNQSLTYDLFSELLH